MTSSKALKQELLLSSKDKLDAQTHAHKGLPNMPDGQQLAHKFVIILTLAPAVIGFCIALGINASSETSKTSARIDAITADDLHWAFAALVVLGRAVAFVNAYPTMYKNAIMKIDSGNIRSNPFVYKAIGQGAGANAVVFDDEGYVGSYNRANRSVHHMIENYAVVLAGLFMVSRVFPVPVFASASLFAVGRVLHQVGYASGYGVHAPGFVLSTLGLVTIEGLAALVALKGFGVL